MENKTFHKATINSDNYSRCVFIGCHITTDYSRFVDCSFIRCTIKNESNSFSRCSFSRSQIILKACYFEQCQVQRGTLSLFEMRVPYLTVIAAHVNLEHVHVRSSYFTRCKVTYKYSTFQWVTGISSKLKCKVCKNGNGPYCDNCTDVRGYTEGNNTRKGKTGKLPTFSFEYEMRFDNDNNACVAYPLIERGFLPTSDCSVSIEYKSPIYQDARSFVRVLPLLEQLKEYVNENAMTHVHVGTPYKLYMLQNYSEIFKEWEEYLVSHERTTRLVFGHYFYHNAHITEEGLDDRYHWLDFDTSYQTIEFRIAAFRSAAQYKRLVQFLRELVAMLNEEIGKQTDHAIIAQKIMTMYLKVRKTALLEAREGVTSNV